MKMPPALYITVNDADRDALDPREIPGDDKPHDVHYRVHSDAEDVAEEGDVYVAEYWFARLVRVTQKTERTTRIIPVEQEAARETILPVPVVQVSIPDSPRTRAAHEDLSDFGCSPELIARAEADAEADDINRLTGRDPHNCVKCGQYGCVCTKVITQAEVQAARAEAGAA